VYPKVSWKTSSSSLTYLELIRNSLCIAKSTLPRALRGDRRRLDATIIGGHVLRDTRTRGFLR
jgi:hypothetical protein